MVQIPDDALARKPYVLSASNRIDFSYLERPKVFEDVDFEKLLASAIQHAEDAEREAGRSPGQIYESHTFAKLLEAIAFLKELLLHRVNEAAQAVLTSHAEGTDLEALGALFGVVRQLLEPLPTDQSREPRFESDVELRRRIALAPERLSLAATEASYIFAALSANDRPTRVVVEKASPQEVIVRYTFDHSYLAASIVDASAISPNPGEAVVTIMDRSEGRRPSEDVVDELQRRFNKPWAKPLTDMVTVRAVDVKPFSVKASITTYPGVDRARLLADARARLDAFLLRQEYIGRDITMDGLRGAIMGPNIHNVLFVSPTEDVVIARTEVAKVTSVELTLGGIDV